MNDLRDILTFRPHVQIDPRYVLGGGEPTITELIVNHYWENGMMLEDAEVMASKYIDKLHQAFQ